MTDTGIKYTLAIISISDKINDESCADAISKLTEREGWDVKYRACVPFDDEKIKKELLYCADELRVQLVLTLGGTGFAERDTVPEVTLAVTEREVPGIAEAMRAAGMLQTPMACLSRGRAGLRKRTLIVNLPGREKSATENLTAVLVPLRHAGQMLSGI